jgi:hypothetical protein
MSACTCPIRVPFVFVLAAAFIAATAAPAISQTLSQKCSASPSWVENPILPESLDESNHCNFAIFSWQSFLALMQPSDGPDGQLVFESYMSSDALFVTDGEQPAAWGKSPWPLTLGKIDLQAGSDQPLFSQSNKLVQYDISVNKPMYNYISKNLLYQAKCFNAGGGKVLMPPTTDPSTGASSIVLKTSWLPMRLCNPKQYHCTTAWLEGRNQTVGLVGIHIVQKLAKHQEWIWSSFEHVNNAPDCAKAASLPSGYRSWAFFGDGSSIAGEACVNCNDSGHRPPNVCRVQPLLSLKCIDGGQLKAGQDPDSNNVVCLNESVPTLLPPDSVWKNYMLVGTLWFKPGMTTPNPTVPAQIMVGNQKLANTTMETFNQGSSCFTCHTPDFRKAELGKDNNAQADFSHIFTRIQALGDPAKACPQLQELKVSHGADAAAAPDRVKLISSHATHSGQQDQ